MASPVCLVLKHVSGGSFCRWMLSQTQTHTILILLGPTADPAFSPNIPVAENKASWFPRYSHGREEIRHENIQDF